MRVRASAVVDADDDVRNEADVDEIRFGGR